MEYFNQENFSKVLLNQEIFATWIDFTRNIDLDKFPLTSKHNKDFYDLFKNCMQSFAVFLAFKSFD